MNKLHIQSAAALLLLCALGCSDDDDGNQDDPIRDAGAQTGEPGDAAPQAAIPTLNGCTSADYQDQSAAEQARLISIAGAGLSFSPKCLIIAAGQKVRWEGSLTAHPLAPGNPADLAAGSADNPITATSTGSNVEFTFPAVGTYPYHCTLHAFGSGQGMAGSIHVR